MNGNTMLASVGGRTLRCRHLMIIAILAAAVTVAFLIRAQPAQYGFELNEFDPFFNYRATLYMVENGIPAYYEWHDTMSWYPNGRDVSATSQVALHMAAAVTYQMFGGGMPLYDYTILFPTIFGALTAVSIFALVRVMGGTSAGLFAAMLYSVSLPILVRSPMGWFKSEPFGLFLSITAAYLLVSGLYSSSRGTAAARMIAAGLLVSASVSAWGGNQFLIIVIGILFLALPFLRRDHGFLLWAVPLFTASVLATSLLFERGVVSTPFSVLALAVSAAFLVACILIQKKSTQYKTRNGLIFLAAVLAVLPAGGVILAESNAVSLPSYRYLNALNPFMTTEIPLVESVAEHATTTLQQSFLFHTVFMIFAGIGAWLVIRALARHRQDKVYVRPDMLAFALMIGIVGVYISSSYVRLEVFAAVSVIIMASLGLSMLSREFLGRGSMGMHDDGYDAAEHSAHNDQIRADGGGSGPSEDAPRPQGDVAAAQTRTSSPKQLSARAQRRAVRIPASPPRRGVGRQGGRRPVPGILSMPYVAGIVALLLLPLVYSGSGASDVFTITDTPPTILTGGASFGTPTDDWTDALAWIKNSTSPDAVIAAWWDYGYWISTVGERTSLADNATIDSERIERLADMFISAPDDAWRDLRDLDADYVLVFVAGQLLESESPVPLYSLQHGGDESKKQWFMRIGGHDPNLYLHMDGLSGTEYFWDSTTVARLFPFSLATYVNPSNPAQQFPTYVPGAVAIYAKDVKYPADGDGPFRLAYSSPSFEAEVPGPMIGVFIYEVNGEYVPADGESGGLPGADLTGAMPPGEAIIAQPDVAEDDVESRNETAATPP
ncbi:MAG: hypothetical protein OXI27_10395 [Thaumarchaeota archaeon]|nr:hypothetical protein [Nitrososphaerota archaeon]